MTRKETIDCLFTEEAGYVNVLAASDDFRQELRSTIDEAGASVLTAKLFCGFVDLKLEKGESVNIKEEMLGAAIFAGNVIGADPSRVTQEFTSEDYSDLMKASKWVGTDDFS